MSRSSLLTVVIGIAYVDATAVSSRAGLYLPCKRRLLRTYRPTQTKPVATVNKKTKKVYIIFLIFLKLTT